MASTLIFILVLGPIIIMMECAIIKRPPECVSVVIGDKLSLGCFTDISTPPSWRFKEPGVRWPKYVFLSGDLKNHSHSLGIISINSTYKGQYDLVFGSVKAETAGAYQCQNNDGMDYGPVAEVVVLDSPLKCTALQLADNDNSTILLHLSCTLKYRHASQTDSFAWSDNHGRLQNCSMNITSDGQWNSVSSRCVVASTKYQPTEYNFRASFHNTSKYTSSEDSCIQQWRYRPAEDNSVNRNTDVNVFQPQKAYFESSSSSWLFAYPYYYILISGFIVVSLVLVILCIVCILRKGNFTKRERFVFCEVYEERGNGSESEDLEEAQVKEKINPCYGSGRSETEINEYASIAENYYDNSSVLIENACEEASIPKPIYEQANRLTWSEKNRPTYETLRA